MQVRTCPNCSAENRSEAEACAKCSWNLADVAPSESRAAAPPGPAAMSPPAARGGSNAGLIILVLIVIAGAAFAGWWFFLRGASPGATVNRFTAAVKAGDFEGMKSTLNKKAVDQFGRVPADRQERVMQFMKEGLGAQTMEVVKTSYEGDNAIVEVEVTGHKLPSENGSHDLVLVKEDGTWKIDFEATGMREMQKRRGGPKGP